MDYEEATEMERESCGERSGGEDARYTERASQRIRLEVIIGK